MTDPIRIMSLDETTELAGKYTVVDDGNELKKVDLDKVSGQAATEAAEASESIADGSGLTADSVGAGETQTYSYETDEASNYLKAADFVDAGLEPNLKNADILLDQKAASLQEQIDNIELQSVLVFEVQTDTDTPTEICNLSLAVEKIGYYTTKMIATYEADGGVQGATVATGSHVARSLGTGIVVDFDDSTNIHQDKEGLSYAFIGEGTEQLIPVHVTGIDGVTINWKIIVETMEHELSEPSIPE